QRRGAELRTTGSRRIREKPLYGCGITRPQRGQRRGKPSVTIPQPRQVSELSIESSAAGSGETSSAIRFLVVQARGNVGRPNSRRPALGPARDFSTRPVRRARAG